ncbi:MAG TPA: alpha-L-fucosidase [Clostridiales bacterium]|nr:alpha-L-fucosidase [Clostridiales bacterium]
MDSNETSRNIRTRWFSEAKIGLFVHWGLYSILGRGEWAMNNERIPKDEYNKLADIFNPDSFNVNTWVSLAKEAGAKYMVMTAKHHDGFALFNSKFDDFNSYKTAARRDFIGEYVDACRKAGLKIGIYYSWMDWQFLGYFAREKYKDSLKEMTEKAKCQIEELMTNYGDIDILWYDGIGFRDPLDKDTLEKIWNTREINKNVRKLQPNILINDRSTTKEDFDTPEGYIIPSAPGRLWESCMTIGGAWGYAANSIDMKPVALLIQNLITVAAYEGNLLLNIGPKGDGSVDEEEARKLKEIGKWLSINGEAIYGCKRAPFTSSHLGLVTVKDNYAYIHVSSWPGKQACLAGVGTEAVSARILGTDIEVGVANKPNGRLIITGLPEKAPFKYHTVIKVEFIDNPTGHTEIF